MSDNGTCYLTAKQTAAILNVSIWTIYRYCKRGDLQAWRAGKTGQLRIVPQSIYDCAAYGPLNKDEVASIEKREKGDES